MDSCSFLYIQLVAEVVGTYFLIFAGCAAVAVNKNNDNVVTLPGISIVWGLAVMVLVYSLGHISGAHFNPAVTIAFATTKRFPLKQVHQTHHFSTRTLEVKLVHHLHPTLTFFIIFYNIQDFPNLFGIVNTPFLWKIIKIQNWVFTRS